MTLSADASVTVEEDTGAFYVLVDGRRLETPCGVALALPEAKLAEAAVEEWRHLRGRADLAVMPLTRLANKAVDVVAATPDESLARLMAYGETDLLCYRAEGPEPLVRRQEEAWRPLLEWAEVALGVRLVPVAGVIAVPQPPDSLAALRAALRGLGPFRLAAVEEAAAITGSVVLALALAYLHVDAEQAWAASRVDEDWQIGRWCRDPEADAQAAARRCRLDQVAHMFAMLGPPGHGPG